MTGPAVLDASALLALLGAEPGADAVAPLLEGALMSTVNWSEVVARAGTVGFSAAPYEARLEGLGLVLAPFTTRQAEIAAGLLGLTRAAGLSLADRACLALALDVGGRPVTADRAWAGVDVGLEVTVIR